MQTNSNSCSWLDLHLSIKPSTPPPSHCLQQLTVVLGPSISSPHQLEKMVDKPNIIHVVGGSKGTLDTMLSSRFTELERWSPWKFMTYTLRKKYKHWTPRRSIGGWHAHGIGQPLCSVLFSSPR